MMDEKRVLFAMPIYKENEQEYCKYLDLEEKKERTRLIEKVKGTKLLNKHYYEWLDEYMEGRKRFREGWRYNRIIGWIEFYIDGSTIKSNLWFIKGKRIPRKLTKKNIKYDGKIEDVTMIHYTSNQTLRRKINDFIEDCQKGIFRKRLKKYYIDSEIFLKNLKYLDILGLIKQSNK